MEPTELDEPGECERRESRHPDESHLKLLEGFYPVLDLREYLDRLAERARGIDELQGDFDLS